MSNSGQSKTKAKDPAAVALGRKGGLAGKGSRPREHYVRMAAASAKKRRAKGKS